jgi:tetratricopeptide (TPR) repeat protein
MRTRAHDEGNRARAAIGLSACLAAMCLLLAFASPAPGDELTADQRAQVFAEAVRAFDRGAEVRQSDSREAIEAFREAAAKFQLLIDSGLANGKLFYNLGNAYLESGQIGRAILNYRRAQELLPGDDRLQHNLDYARSLRRNDIEASGRRAFLHTLLFWHYGTALRSRYAVGLGAYVAFWLLLALSIVLPRFRWQYAWAPALALWLALGVSVTAGVLAQSHHREGVIVADDVVVRKGAGERFAAQFEQRLHQGVEFTVLEEHRDWWHVELPNGQAGWVRSEQAELM